MRPTPHRIRRVRAALRAAALGIGFAAGLAPAATAQTATAQTATGTAPPPAAIEVTVQAPAVGRFWAVGPLPIDTPDHLVGPGGASAHRLETLGDHHAIYGIEADAARLPAGRLRFTPVADDAATPAWESHPAVLAAAATMFGQVRIRDRESREPAWERVQDGPFRNRFAATHDLGDWWVRLWFDVFARSPVVQVAGFVARKDRTLEKDVPIEIAFGAQVAFPLERLHGGRLGATTNAIRGNVDLERAGIYPLRFTLLFGGRDPADPAGVVEIDETTKLALQAGVPGPRWFLPGEWRGEWFGIVPRTDTPACRELARQGLARWQEAQPMTAPRPWASMPRAGQGGSQPSLALAWWAPALVDPALRPHDVHLWSAEDWALRPVHLFEPGSADPVRDVLAHGGTTAHRQIHEDVDIGGQAIPRFQTPGGLAVPLPGGRSDHRTSHDEQHMADTPLLAAYALTGDPLLRWILDSHRALDLASRQVARGWRSNGRGEGRSIASVLNAARLVGGEPLDQVLAWSRQRIAHAAKEASSRDLSESAIVRPVHLYSDDRLNCRHPCLMVYEEAQLAWGAWLVYRATGDRAALDAAWRYGLTVAAQLYRPNDQAGWAVPYAVWITPDGRPLTEAELRDPELVHPASWTLLWSGSGLRAFLAAAEERGPVPPELVEYLDRAEAALRQIDSMPLGKIEEIHQSLWGARVPTPR